ncbi:hypothetical protein CLU79DRAFT_776133 [Phycomyces nitens]|nr:hypothetical protein CLU79DRAFT_776133 [Phycomyces nitens]
MMSRAQFIPHQLGFRSPPPSSPTLPLPDTPTASSSFNLMHRVKRSLSSSGVRPAIPAPLGSFSKKSDLDSRPLPQKPKNLANMAHNESRQRFETDSVGSHHSLGTPSFGNVVQGTGSLNSTQGSASSLRLSSPAFPRRNSFDTTNVSVKQKYNQRGQARASPLPRPVGELHPPTALPKNPSEKPTLLSIPTAPAPAMYWSRPITYGTSPRPVRGHASVVVDGVMYVFGGSDSRGCMQNVYMLELDTFTWTKPVVHGDRPPPCRAHYAAVDEEEKKVYMFGGGDGPTYYNHLYVFDTLSMLWSQPEVKGPVPSPRRAHTTVIWNKSFYLFGGGDGDRALNDVHALDLNTFTWTPIETTGPKPIAKGYQTGTLVGNILVVYGGSDGHECYGDIHLLDLKTMEWNDVKMAHTYKRLSHATVCIGSFLFIMAGHDGNYYSNDLLLLNLISMHWEVRKVYGQMPSPRGYHTMVFYDSRLFVFGGFDGKTFYNDLHVLDLSSWAYLPQITNFAIDMSD